jgi:hypothetical protein
MAYVSQDLKAKLAPTIKAICKKHGVKGSIAVRNHMTLVLNVKSGKIDFIGNTNRVCGDRRHTPAKGCIDVNTYWYKEHFDGDALAFLQEVIPAMNNGNHDRSDIQSDYFDVGWYIDVNVGKWNKPYIVESI